MPEAFDARELAGVLRVMQQALDLFNEESRDLDRQNEPYDMTRSGTTILAGSVEKSVGNLAQALGFAAAGLDHCAARSLRLARFQPALALERFARPLRTRTVQGLERLARVSDFFDNRQDGESLAARIEAGLLAPAATWPPPDWREYDRQQRILASRGSADE